MNNAESMVQILIYFLIGIAILFFVLSYVFIMLKIKKSKEEKKLKNEESPMVEKEETSGKQSVFKFMEFDKIEDNMILQKNGARFLMVIECQGINYDLMSGVEKTSVEEGFVQFLNTLRHPIQIYTQTRTINLENSINTYKSKVSDIEKKLFNMRQEYNEMLSSGNYTKEQIEKQFYELTKQTNLYEYGKDIVEDTEKMSFNKNILNKKYYIIIPYYSSELDTDNLDKREIQSLAFSELYTRAQALVRTISACGVTGRILNSTELAELLYMAYNRDEAEVFGIDRALKAGYDEMYSTAPDVFEKRLAELDKYIEEKAIDKVEEKVFAIRSKREKEVREKEASVDELIDELAKSILEENKRYIGKKVAEEAIQEIEKETKEGGNVDGKKKTRRATKTTITSK